MNDSVNELENLLAYADGTLSPAKAREVEMHLASNPDDANLIAQYQLIRKRVAGDDSVEPSLAAIARARAIFNPVGLPKREQNNWLSVIDRLIARCVFDSRVGFAGVRYAATDHIINLSLEAPGAGIDIQAERIELDESTGKANAAFWKILGQINCDHADVEGICIALTRRGSIAPLIECTADEHGAFSMEAQPDRYDLHIRLANGVALIRDLDLG